MSLSVRERREFGWVAPRPSGPLAGRDQAEGLRRLMRRPVPGIRVVSLIGAAPGLGAALAQALSDRGEGDWVVEEEQVPHADEAIVALTLETARAAYATLKRLVRERVRADLSVLVMDSDPDLGRRLGRGIADVAERFLGVRIGRRGVIEAGRGLESVARALIERPPRLRRDCK